ncbi:MAG: adenosylcobinamide-GDP ribazoletransferase [Moraxella sp.]|nr:adenosylcobinamide-GDP ribazoletransferase [Moraxella sp.]
MNIKNAIIMPFFIAVQFMTVLPITLASMPNPRQNALSVLYYPLIGLMIGGLLTLTAWVLSFLPLMVSSVMVLTVWVCLTGGLHLDGVADMADGVVGGYGDKERTLAIMKDPNTGAMGVIALVVVLLLKFSLIYALMEQNALMWLIIVPIIGRMMSLVLFLTTPYVRTDGIGKAMSDYLPKRTTWAVLGCWVLVLAVGLYGAGVLMVVLGAGFLGLAWGYRCYWRRRIGGMTGDIIGGAIELTEVMMLVLMVGHLSGVS